MRSMCKHNPHWPWTHILQHIFDHGAGLRLVHAHQRVVAEQDVSGTHGGAVVRNGPLRKGVGGVDGVGIKAKSGQNFNTRHTPLRTQSSPTPSDPPHPPSLHPSLP